MTRGRLEEKRIDLKGGEFFHVLLKDNSYSLGQFVQDTPKALNSCLCVFYSNTFAEKPQESKIVLSNLRPIAVLVVTRDSLISGKWNIICDGDVEKLRNSFLVLGPAYSKVKKLLNLKSYVGTKIYGSGIIRDFLNAYHGLASWNMMKDPTYFDKLLLKGCTGPIQNTSKDK